MKSDDDDIRYIVITTWEKRQRQRNALEYWDLTQARLAFPGGRYNPSEQRQAFGPSY